MRFIRELCTKSRELYETVEASDRRGFGYRSRRRGGGNVFDAAAASLAVVTADGQSRLIEDAEVQKYLDLVEVEKTAAQTEGMELEGGASA